MTTHVMIDLETLGTGHHAGILSVGAQAFDIETGEMLGTFHEKVMLEDVVSRDVDASTLKWWLEQDSEARNAVFLGGPRYPLIHALNGLRSWCHNQFPVRGVWGNGATFDISILADAYNGNPPWDFLQVRDMRTIVALLDGFVAKKDFPFEGVQHDALADATHQAEIVSSMWRKSLAALAVSRSLGEK